MATVDIEEVWNMLGFGRMQFIIFLSCSLLQMYIANEQLGLSVILVTSACDLHINNERMGWLVASVFLAQFLSSHYFGYKTDQIGRLKVLLQTSVLTLVASFLSAFMPGYWPFLLLRFMVGVFLAGVSVTLLTYLSEFTKVSLRPKVSNYLSFSIGISMIYVPALAFFLIPTKIHLVLGGNYAITVWRILIISNLLPGIIGVCILYRLPESAKFYLSISKEAEAMEVLERCCRMNKGKGTTLASLGVDRVTQGRLQTPQDDHNLFMNYWYELISLFKGKYLRYMILSLSVSFVLFSTGFGLTIWILRIRFITQAIEKKPLILCDILDAAHNVSAPKEFCALNPDNMTVSMMSGCAALIAFGITSILFTLIRRRTILLIYTLLAGILGSLFNVLKDDLVIIGVFMLFVVLPLCCLRLVLSVVIDLIPTHLRAKAVALTFMAGRLGIMFASLFVGYTLKFCCWITFNTFALGLLFATVMIFLLPSEDSLTNIITDESKL